MKGFKECLLVDEVIVDLLELCERIDVLVNFGALVLKSPCSVAALEAVLEAVSFLLACVLVVAFH